MFMETLTKRSNQILIASVAFYIYAYVRSSSSSTGTIEPFQWSKTIESSSKSNSIIPEFVASDIAFVATAAYDDNDELLGTYEQYYSQLEQSEFLKRHGQECVMENVENSVHNAFTYLSKSSPSHAVELFKFCVLQHELRKKNVAIASFNHAESFLLYGNDIISHDHDRNFAVVNTQKKMIHGSLLIVKNNQADVLKAMAEYIVGQMERMEFEPFLLAREFYRLIHQQVDNGGSVSWNLLELICDVNSLEYGCQAQHGMQKSSSSKNRRERTRTILLTPRQYLPYQATPNDAASPPQFRPLGMNSKSSVGGDRETPYITTITSITSRQTPNNAATTPNFYDILSSKDCLPTSKICEACMKTLQGGDCRICHKFCGCFCDSLCKTEVKDKVVTKVFEYKAPLYKRVNIDYGSSNAQVERLIPNIVHQTWFESITREKYPNFSRLVESWNQTNWDYRFYNDKDVEDFLSTHFPPEVTEAYEALLPGAFKADLFRYCVLFIHGGVYADVDVLLESKLDTAIDDDVGFMVPLDAVPGRQSGHQVCLWNGFMAAAPGHPFLAAVIEAVVNNVRNRFTSLDVMNSMCPVVDFFLSHRSDILFTTGPCILGVSVNRFLGRHPQTSFANSTETLLEHSRDKVPGRVVILHANKKDMGCHRFTLVEKNLIVAATDMPEYDDRESVDGHNTHYSKLRVKGRIYGMSGLYKDRDVAHEAIKFVAV